MVKLVAGRFLGVEPSETLTERVGLCEKLSLPFSFGGKLAEAESEEVLGGSGK